jgi:hypothetical protein
LEKRNSKRGIYEKCFTLFYNRRFAGDHGSGSGIELRSNNFYEQHGDNERQQRIQLFP